ncbi:unnamed protein product [Polarella glacialis]|uniref:Glycosyl transferase CAP10 domain-containing protein n=1 Tax=Polarella glacialis TaxID=89957 RepID=A0A813GLM7_POLGL|nr:unnamed protein product [Polarella glacialis]
MDREAKLPSPLFSICASADFWDILFPNVCRPALVNMSAMSAVPWRKKKGIAFWRGTDRGAVNWALELRDMYSGSPRKRFLDSWAGDKMLAAIQVEPVLPSRLGVGFSARLIPVCSLKQKLTASSAVLLLTDVGVPGASPVYEHYHSGLQDKVHVLRVTMEDAGKKVRWARDHDKEMQSMVRNANDYMSCPAKLGCHFILTCMCPSANHQLVCVYVCRATPP